jgi:hypothetical protein
MKSLGDQFADIIDRQMPKAIKAIVKETGKAINAQMHRNVDRGVGFDGKEYQQYAESTAKDRERLGFKFSLTPVTFQRFDENIKKSTVESISDDVAKIVFHGKARDKYSWANVFYFHQHGMGNNPERLIFPKEEKHIPKTIIDEAHKKGALILNGSK